MSLLPTYGRLTVIQRAPNAEGSRHASHLCRCSCGKEVTVCARNLRSGATRSCGCLRNEMTARRSACGSRTPRIPDGAPADDGLYKWGYGMPKTMKEICRAEDVNYLMVWRKTPKMGLKEAVLAARRHQLEKC